MNSASSIRARLNLRNLVPNQEGGADVDQVSKLNLELNYPQLEYEYDLYQ